nr:MAG TPA: Protein of unknown function (DUF1642) [Caudoviricetes sp.]
MNKQELIGKYEYMSHACFRRVDTLEVLKDLRQLDEPQKVTIPQFVADVIEGAREKSAELEDAFEYAWEATFRGEFREWFMKLENRNTFARAWLDGYKVEKEPKYTVKFKATNQYLCDDDGIGLHISPSFRSNFRKSDLEKLSLTEVFDSPLFEVEEVTE